MAKTKLVLYTISILTISAGFAVIGVGAFFLKRLDDHAFGDPVVFYAAARHYGSITSEGAFVSLAGCIGLALVLDYRGGARAGLATIAIGFATALFGAFLFPVHNASGAVYFTLIGLTFGASVVFLSVAAVRYALNGIHFARR